MFIRVGEAIINTDHIISIRERTVIMIKGEAYSISPEAAEALIEELCVTPKPAKDILAQVKQERTKEVQDWNKR